MNSPIGSLFTKINLPAPIHLEITQTLPAPILLELAQTLKVRPSIQTERRDTSVVDKFYHTYH